MTAVTQLFQEGLIQVVIGTKSLLGEGWDAPCVNSLILASFVGSFMLSNQMRGRAIRVWPEDPDKTSNIWHLVSINLSLKKWYEKSDLEKEEIEAITDQLKEYSPDLELLERRMKQFLGLHYKEPFIESGIERLAFDNIRYTKKHLQKLNEETLERSTHVKNSETAGKKPFRFWRIWRLQMRSKWINTSCPWPYFLTPGASSLADGRCFDRCFR